MQELVITIILFFLFVVSIFALVTKYEDWLYKEEKKISDKLKQDEIQKSKTKR